MAKDRQKVIQSAEKLAARGRIQAAIDEYRKVLDPHPNDTTTLNRVGDLYLRLNRLPKAIDLFQKTAESYGRQGFFVKAIAIYKKMIRLDPGQIRAYEALADLYNRQGLTGDSLAQYQVVADYYVKHDDAEAALNVHYSMVEIEPSNPTRRLQLADVLQKQGKTTQAQEQYFEIASLMLTHSRGDDALKVLIGALDVETGNLDFVRKAMHALQNAGFDRLADELLNQAAQRNPQANALRLDILESPEPAMAPVAEDEEPVVKEDQPAAATDEAEIELSQLEELPPASLDPVVEPEAEVDAPLGAEVDDAVVELEAPDGDSTFELEDVDEAVAVTETAAVEADAPDEISAETPAEAVVEDEEEFSFELDIDEVSAQVAEVDLESAPAVGAEQVAEADEAAAAPEVDDDAVVEVEVAPEAEVEPVAESTAKPQGEWTKLLIEADVLGRYGMNEMAIAVLERILRAEPEHAGALTRSALLQLDAQRTEEALASANRLAELVARDGEPDRWDEMRAAMAEHGFDFEDGRFAGEVAAVAPEEATEEEDGRFAEEVAALAPEEAAEEAVEEIPAEQSLEAIVAETAALTRPKPGPLPDSADGVLAEVIEEIERSGPPDSPDEAAEEVDDELVSDDVEWIRELERAEEAATSNAPLEPGTGEFVDLATELEAELSDDGGFEDELLPTMGEQSLEDIVEGFRQGMAETLADEDFETHYNLGIAYREMGLLDEAIGEFQLAARDPRYLVECCSLLAACFIDKDFNDLAVQWYARGIESVAIDDEAKCGLLYELGSLLVATGEPEAARERFLELYGVNSNYRDVVAKLEELPS